MNLAQLSNEKGLRVEAFRFVRVVLLSCLIVQEG